MKPNYKVGDVINVPFTITDVGEGGEGEKLYYLECYHESVSDLGGFEEQELEEIEAMTNIEKRKELLQRNINELQNELNKL